MNDRYFAVRTSSSSSDVSNSRTQSPIVRPRGPSKGTDEAVSVHLAALSLLLLTRRREREILAVQWLGYREGHRFL